MTPSPQVYQDRADVIETFSDHCERVIFDGQTLRVDLSVARYGESGADRRPSAVRTTACRLTPQAALQLHDQLQRLVATMEEKGLVKKRPAVTRTKQ
jgi:hypothetical protein